MQLVQSPSKPQVSPRLVNLFVVSSSVCTIFLFISFFLVFTSTKLSHLSFQDAYVPTSTSLEHIVFGIASNQKDWTLQGKEYVRVWWKHQLMRGCVFLESLPPDHQNLTKDISLPPVCISGDTSKFRYTYRGGPRSAIRLARVVSETVALNHSNVRWFVFGDDDTVFFPENLVKTLCKYDHELWYYVGGNSEFYEKNRVFGFGMAFGGAGFAISYPLAKALAKVFDSCIERYPHLYGSDSRVASCVAELGIGLTHEPGFHQNDLRGNTFGLLASHPLSPLVSLHHLQHTDPIFPNMTTMQALQHLLKATNVDSQRILQKTVCYDRWFSWTVSVSWGYAVQIYGNHIFLPDVLPVQETFKRSQSRNILSGVYTFNTRELHPDPCRRPVVFFHDNVSSIKGGITTIYKKSYENCSYDKASSPRKLEEVRVFSHKLDLDIRQLQAPRRHCCDVLPFTRGEVMDIAIRECKDEELIHMHS